MPPKAQTIASRRGRPAKAAEPNIPVAAMVPSNPKKRGRPAKIDAVPVVTVEPLKKRGRPAKARTDEPIAQIDQAIKRGRRSVAAAEETVAEVQTPTRKRAGRPAKTAAVAEVAVAPKKRGGRPRKEDAAPEAPATPKRRGRPALDLTRVTGSSRVVKRTSPRSKPVSGPLINHKADSRLRTRTAPVKKNKKAVDKPVKKARGRPKKVEIEKTPALKNAAGRGRKPAALIPAASAKKITARPKTAVPRKRRGYTSLEVADKFAAQVQRYISDLQAEEAANAAAAAGEADDEGEEIEVEVELGTEDATGFFDSVQTEIEADKAADELAEDEGEDMLIDPAEVGEAAALDEEQLLRDTGGAEELAPESDDFDEDTELPSESAVLAEIAAVQDELDVQNDIEQGVEMREVAQAELERQSPASHALVDFSKELAKVSSISQIDGSNEIEVFHSHVHGHDRVFDAPAPEPVPGAKVGSLFTGF